MPARELQTLFFYSGTQSISANLARIVITKNLRYLGLYHQTKFFLKSSE